MRTEVSAEEEGKSSHRDGVSKRPMASTAFGSSQPEVEVK